MKPRRKLPPVKSRPPRRKGNHPSNPYAAEAETALRHEDRAGWPWPRQPNRDGPPGPFPSRTPRIDDLSDEAQLGCDPPSVQAVPYEAAEAHVLAARMDAWREGIAARRRDGPAGAVPADTERSPGAVLGRTQRSQS